MSARFKIKMNPWGGVLLTDREKGTSRAYDSLRGACLAMDNRVRREKGAPPRLDVTRAEIREAMRGHRVSFAALVGRHSVNDIEEPTA